MDPRFATIAEALAPKLEALLAMPPMRHGAIPKTLPKAGVYLFSQGDEHLYVGRSSNLRKRFYRHFAHPRGAAFAFLLARQSTGRTERVYKKGSGGTRDELMDDDVFKAAFDAARVQMKMMDYRCVEEPDPYAQAVLEVYAAFVLKTPHNDFDNH